MVDRDSEPTPAESLRPSPVPGSAPRPPAGEGAAAGWRELARELDAWAAASRTACFWWRDDDAVAPSPALERLLAVQAAAVPLALAVIPAGAGPALASVVARTPGVSVVQHGFAHLNHAPPPAKKAELTAGRALPELVGELGGGRRRLEGLFSARFLPALVPPWNRIPAALLPLLPAAGIAGVSAFGRRRAASPAAGLRQANCHLDPIDWHGGRGFVGGRSVLASAVGELAARRQGAADPEEPIGLLTHHLVLDGAGFAFVGEFLARTRAHPAVRWIAIEEALWPAR